MTELAIARPRPTRSELVILRLVARGLTNRAIGRELWLTEQTIKFHVANLFRKFEVSNRTQLVVRALQLEIIELGELG